MSTSVTSKANHLMRRELRLDISAPLRDAQPMVGRGRALFFLYLQGAAESSRTSITLTCEHGHTGERDPEERESRDLHPYVIGDVLNDKSLIGDESYRTDTKRLQEPSGFILQSLKIG